MKKSSTPNHDRPRKGHPAVAGVIVGIIVVAVAIIVYMGLPSVKRHVTAPTAVAAPVETAAQESESSTIAFNGTPVARTEWTDGSGSHVVILSRTESTLEARHYSQSRTGSTLVAERVEPLPDDTYAAGFYRDGVWASDMAGDGNQEALFAYYIDASSEPGPKRLVLVVFAGDGTLSMNGSTRYDPATGERVAQTATIDDAMRAAPAGIQSEAMRLWNEAQFDLAEPAAFPGFYDVMRLDGAEFHGDGPSWVMVVLPQFVLFKYSSTQTYSVIKYAAITRSDTSVVLEGSGDVDAWNHKFRITVTEEPIIVPHGETYPYTVIIDWSDGTRLQGWGEPARPSS
ncbi:MAG TPA: hypothetical protein VMX33_14305 [bacterium]|nr:hypothetical protein [bacterium]